MGEGLAWALRLRGHQAEEDILLDPRAMQNIQELVWYMSIYAEGQTQVIANDKIKKGMLPEDTFTFLSSIVMRHNGNC